MDPLQYGFGWIPDAPDQRDQIFSAMPEILTALPTKSSLRSKLGKVWNQLTLGSCTAFATLKAIVLNRRQQSIVEMFPSFLFQYYNTRSLMGTIGSDSGASIRDSIKCTVQFGYVEDEKWPYNPSRFRERPPETAYLTAKQNLITDYLRVTQSLEQIKSVLADSNDPNLVVCGFSVYSSIREAQTTGRIPLPKMSERQECGHAIALCGYDDATQHFEFVNSWGESWGDSGYGYIPYSYILNPNLAADFWVIKTVPGGNPVPPDPVPPDPVPPVPGSGIVTVDYKKKRIYCDEDFIVLRNK